MLPILIGVCVGFGVLLWSGSTRGRLQSLLGESRTDPTDTEAATPETGTPESGTARAVADDQLAFDLDLVAICLTSGLPIPVALT